MRYQGLADLSIRLRWVSIVLFAIATAFFASQLPKAQLDTELLNQLPQRLENRVNLAAIEELFGSTDMAMIVVSGDDLLQPSSLARIEKLSRGMHELDELERVVSLFTAKHVTAKEGELLVEPAVKRISAAPGGRAELAERLKQNRLVYGNLLSRDFKHSVLIGFVAPKTSDATLVGNLQALVRDNPGSEEVLLGGMPVTRVKLAEDMQTDMKRFIPLGLLLMLVFLFLCFRQARGVVLPSMVTLMATIMSMGMIPILGWKIHTVTILLPVILLAVANDYGIHLVARYQEDNRAKSSLSKHELARMGAGALGRPILATGITTIFGMLCLLSHLVVPAKQLGVLAAVGVGVAMLGSLLLVPALLAVLPRAKPVVTTQTASGSPDHPGMLERALARVARWVVARPRRVLVSCVFVTAIVGLGATRLTIDTNPMSFYHPGDPVWRSTHLLNEHLGGWAGLSIVFEGDIKAPEVLEEVARLEQHLQRLPNVGTHSSIAGVLSDMHRLMHGNDPQFARVPETRELVAQYLLLYSLSGDPRDLEKMVDFSFEHAHLMLKVTQSSSSAAAEVVEAVRQYQREHQPPIQYVGGLLDVMADMAQHIVRGQLLSIATAAALIWAFVSAWFRSLVAGLYALAPLGVALLLLFGVMGLFGIELNLVTALLSSIMIGIGVDYSIHFLWRCRAERRLGLGAEAAVVRTLTTTGRGIVFNGLSVIVGFAVLIVSNFYPVRFFGLLITVSITAALVGALVILPALAIWWRPRFLEPKASSQ